MKVKITNKPKTKKINRTSWPQLPYSTWQDTLETVHLWTQIVGKIKLQQNSFLNHWWEVALYITPHGLTTGRIPYNTIAFEIAFDFIFHKLTILTSEGKEKIIELEPMRVADFYKKFMQALKQLGIQTKINTLPSEISHPIPFEKDFIHASYEKKYVEKWHSLQLQASFILDDFRSDFRGKSSPVQFFWGSFDLNTTRFSGERLPDKTDWPKGYHFMRYAENEENFACGFWPGNEKFPNAAFYSYVYPTPKGCETMNTGSVFSYFHKKLTECILPYEAAIQAKDPRKEILSFFNTTYKEYAKLAGWDIKKLQGITPVNKME